MVALNFQPEFVPMIRRGDKRQTCRRVRKKGQATPGVELQLYTGMRTPAVDLIARAKCIRVRPISLILYEHPSLNIDGVFFTKQSSLEAFAKADGFPAWTDLEKFFIAAYGAKTFDGVLIQWGELIE